MRIRPSRLRSALASRAQRRARLTRPENRRANGSSVRCTDPGERDGSCEGVDSRCALRALSVVCCLLSAGRQRNHVAGDRGRDGTAGVEAAVSHDLRISTPHDCRSEHEIIQLLRQESVQLVGTLGIRRLTLLSLITNLPYPQTIHSAS